VSDIIDWGWVRRTLTNVQAEQRMLRGLVEPLPKRFQALEERMSAMEARFSALEARIGGLEEGINGIGLALRHQGELLVDVARKLGA
jgi:archaellum component FlaC